MRSASRSIPREPLPQEAMKLRRRGRGDTADLYFQVEVFVAKRSETSDYHNAARFAFKIFDISDFSFRIIATMEILAAFSNPKSPIQNPVRDDFECC